MSEAVCANGDFMMFVILSFPFCLKRFLIDNEFSEIRVQYFYFSGISF